MHILYTAYPLLTVSEESAGGAEQVLWTLEREMARRGVKTTVAASAGSRVAGELFVTGEPCSGLDDYERRNQEHQEGIVELVRRRELEGPPLDLIHDMSGSFWPCAASIHTPVLATLHLPRSFYSARLSRTFPRTFPSIACLIPKPVRLRTSKSSTAWSATESPSTNSNR